MSKIQVYKLAKELGLDNKSLLEKMKGGSFELPEKLAAITWLTADVADKVRELIKGQDLKKEEKERDSQKQEEKRENHTSKAQAEFQSKVDENSKTQVKTAPQIKSQQDKFQNIKLGWESGKQGAKEKKQNRYEVEEKSKVQAPKQAPTQQVQQGKQAQTQQAQRDFQQQQPKIQRDFQQQQPKVQIDFQQQQPKIQQDFQQQPKVEGCKG